MTNRSIYVSVPSQNDSQFIPTILRCIENATNKSNIHIGSSIFWKNEDIDNNKKPFFLKFDEVLSKIPNIKFDILPYHYYPGVGNGRTQSLKFYNDEKYYLSIDSHTQFDEGWDERLIESYEKSSKSFGKRRVITSYLPGYFIDSDGEINYLDDSPKWQFFSYDFQRSPFFPVPDDRAIREKDNPIYDHLIDEVYLPARKISAHFTFTEAEYWVKSCRINLDPRIIFWAEEFYQSALAWSRGYSLVWTKEIFMRHLYSNSITQLIDEKTGSVTTSGKVFSRSNKYEFFENIDDKNSFYKKYIKNSKYPLPHIVSEEQIIMDLMHQRQFYGFLPRSPKGFCKYTGVNLETKRANVWKEVPKLDVIFK
jgi:hypothetical protein